MIRRRFLAAPLWAALSLSAGCSSDRSASPVSKVIAAKDNPIKNRIAWTDTIFSGKDGGIRTKSRTIYYLIAEDGTACEVSMGTWHKVKVGESFASDKWKER